MYREYRDLTVSAAVTQCYRDMGARHRARAHSIQVYNGFSFFNSLLPSLDFFQMIILGSLNCLDSSHPIPYSFRDSLSRQLLKIYKYVIPCNIVCGSGVARNSVGGGVILPTKLCNN